MSILVPITFVSEYRMEGYISHSPVRRVVYPNVDESSAMIVVDCRDPDLSEDDRPVRGLCARDKDEVFANVELR